MASTITLHKTKFDGLGSVLDKLCSCFGNYDSTMKELKRSASGVDSTTCDLEAVIDDISNSEESKEEKVKRAKELKSKLDTFVKSAVQHEKDAADEIVKKKKDFYKKYDYLRPDSEKSRWERFKEKISGVAKAIGQWMYEHLDMIIAALIVIAAIVIVIVCPAAVCAILSIIVGVASALMGIADLVCLAATGKDVATWMDEDMGWHTASKIWKGVGLGLDIASVILPIGALPSAGANAYKTTFKELIRHPIKSLKGLGNNMAVKNFGNMLRHPITSLKGLGKAGLNTVKEAFKDGALKGFKNLGTGGLKMLTGYDDLKKGKALFNAWKSGQPVGETAIKLLGLDNIARLAGSSNMERYDNMLNSNSDTLAEAVSGNNIATDSFTQMKVDVTTGSGNSGDALFNTLNGNDELSRQLLDSTGVDMRNVSNGDDLWDALRNNGFTLDTSAGGAAGTSNVSVVPSWAYRATDGGSGSLQLMTHNISGVNHDFRHSVMQDYTSYMNTMNNIFQNSFANNCADNMFKKGMEHLMDDGIFGNLAPKPHNRVDDIIQRTFFKTVEAPWLG